MDKVRTWSSLLRHTPQPPRLPMTPPTPLAAAIDQDGRWLPARRTTSTLLAAVPAATLLMTAVPIVGDVPAPATRWSVVAMVLAVGILDARAGLLASLLAASTGATAATGIADVMALAVQLLVLASLGGLLALASNELARSVLERVPGRWKMIPDRPAVFLRMRSIVWIYLAIGVAVAVLAVGWMTAAPVLLGSAIWQAAYEDLAPAPAAVFAVGLLAALLVPTRLWAEQRTPPTRRQLPVPTYRWNLVGQVCGGLTLFILLSSLYLDSLYLLGVAFILIMLIRMVRTGLVPPPTRLLGPAGHRRLSSMPPLYVFLGVLAFAILVGSFWPPELGSVRVALLLCLALVLLLAQPVPVVRPDSRRVVSSPANAALVIGAAAAVVATSPSAAASQGSTSSVLTWTATAIDDDTGEELSLRWHSEVRIEEIRHRPFDNRWFIEGDAQAVFERTWPSDAECVAGSDYVSTRPPFTVVLGDHDPLLNRLTDPDGAPLVATGLGDGTRFPAFDAEIVRDDADCPIRIEYDLSDFRMNVPLEEELSLTEGFRLLLWSPYGAPAGTREEFSWSRFEESLPVYTAIPGGGPPRVAAPSEVIRDGERLMLDEVPTDEEADQAAAPPVVDDTSDALVVARSSEEPLGTAGGSGLPLVGLLGVVLAGGFTLSGRTPAQVTGPGTDVLDTSAAPGVTAAGSDAGATLPGLPDADPSEVIDEDDP